MRKRIHKTEFYLACRDNGYLSITEFSVTDENGSYTYTENWDVSASFEEKAGKCGIVETDALIVICNQDGTPLTDDTCDIGSFGYDGQISDCG